MKSNATIQWRIKRTGIVILTLTILEGCALPFRHDAVPPTLQAQAEIPGMPGVRYFPAVPRDVERMATDGVESFYRERAIFAAQGGKGDLPPANYLAISGGGDKGAFGAGLLTGWSAQGSRPTFKLVTGVSTGALMAPFAFLGSRYDKELKAIYTGVSPGDILERRNFTAALWDDAMADNAPLWRLLEKYIDWKMVGEIASEYQKGRLLLVATTNLDSQLPVIWNLTKIAASGNPRSLDLIRKLMIASAAIPGVFPPVLIDVEAKGKVYQEMHVDGGASTQIFLYPPTLGVAKLLSDRDEQRKRKLFIIRNARLDQEWAQVNRRTLPIIQRAINSLIQSQGIGDLYRMYLTTKQDHIEFNLAYIASTFNVPHQEDFEMGFMRQLFDYGYQLARRGYPWENAPPGFKSE